MGKGQPFSEYALRDDQELKEYSERYWREYDNQTARLNASTIKLYNPLEELKRGSSLMNQMIERLLGEECHIVFKDGKSMNYVTLRAFDSECLLVYGYFTDRILYRECVILRSEIKLISQYMPYENR